MTEQYQLIETRLQEKLANGTMRCNLCLWRCKIGHGQRGFCQAHVNRNGTLYNLSYGILSAIDIDFIEEKPVKHYRPGTKVMMCWQPRNTCCLMPKPKQNVQG